MLGGLVGEGAAAREFAIVGADAAVGGGVAGAVLAGASAVGVGVDASGLAVGLGPQV